MLVQRARALEAGLQQPHQQPAARAGQRDRQRQITPATAQQPQCAQGVAAACGQQQGVGTSAWPQAAQAGGQHHGQQRRRCTHQCGRPRRGGAQRPGLGQVPQHLQQSQQRRPGQGLQRIGRRGPPHAHTHQGCQSEPTCQAGAQHRAQGLGGRALGIGQKLQWCLGQGQGDPEKSDLCHHRKTPGGFGAEKPYQRQAQQRLRAQRPQAGQCQQQRGG